MFTIAELSDFLKRNSADFEIIRQESPIISTQDAKKYFDIDLAAPALIVQTEKGLMLLIASAKRGRLDFPKIGMDLGFSKMKLADKKKIQRSTGYAVGAIPLVGVDLPCIFDDRLLENDFIYGGSGDELFTLKISPGDVKRLNHVIFSFD